MVVMMIMTDNNYDYDYDDYRFDDDDDDDDEEEEEAVEDLFIGRTFWVVSQFRSYRRPMRPFMSDLTVKPGNSVHLLSNLSNKRTELPMIAGFFSLLQINK